MNRGSISRGFEQTHERVETLEKRTNAGFQSIHNAFEKFTQTVRSETNGAARRVKRLEESVFGVGK